MLLKELAGRVQDITTSLQQLKNQTNTDLRIDEIRNRGLVAALCPSGIDSSAFTRRFESSRAIVVPGDDIETKC
jgi:hypothetical protein